MAWNEKIDVSVGLSGQARQDLVEVGIYPAVALAAIDDPVHYHMHLCGLTV
jgi:hypothetical protein